MIETALPPRHGRKLTTIFHTGTKVIVDLALRSATTFTAKIAGLDLCCLVRLTVPQICLDKSPLVCNNTISFRAAVGANERRRHPKDPWVALASRRRRRRRLSSFHP
jgi:hypothetical protein